MAVLGELAARGKALYESKLKPLLEPEQKGKFIAIEPDTEQYFLGKTGTEALLAARAALPDKLFFLARVGYPAAHTIGGYGWRKK
jgi:hypothetical protein